MDLLLQQSYGNNIETQVFEFSDEDNMSLYLYVLHPEYWRMIMKRQTFDLNSALNEECLLT